MIGTGSAQLAADALVATIIPQVEPNLMRGNLTSTLVAPLRLYGLNLHVVLVYFECHIIGI